MKKPDSKRAKIVGAYQTDVALALNWAKLNKAIRSAGGIIKVGDRYVVNVKSKISKKDLSYLIKERFGIFVSVV